jgi:CBS domain containing-hemolysin-like protein
MDYLKVRDIMVPLARYATVSEDSNFHEAVLALKLAQSQFGQQHDTPKTILVFDKEARIAGQIDYWDLLRAIEPRYSTMGYPRQIIDRECSDCEFAGSIFKTYGLWKEPLEELCTKAAEVTANEIMRPIKVLECIEEEAPMEEAVNSMITRHLGLMVVTQGGEAVGVLRLTDVADRILYKIDDCRLPFEDDSEKQPDNLAA